MAPEKIVVHYLNGRILKGYVETFDSKRPAFVMRPEDRQTETEEVPLQAVKGVFFVKSFEGHPEYREQKEFTETQDYFGTRTKVVCRDGEVLIGTTQGVVNVQESQGSGFYFFPADRESNNIKAFLSYPAVRKVAYVT
jgi:small nuclear ribonucleoprotein (snRNP)-like protein